MLLVLASFITSHKNYGDLEMILEVGERCCFASFSV